MLHSLGPQSSVAPGLQVGLHWRLFVQGPQHPQMSAGCLVLLWTAPPTHCDLPKKPPPRIPPVVLLATGASAFGGEPTTLRSGESARAARPPHPHWLSSCLLNYRLPSKNSRAPRSAPRCGWSNPLRPGPNPPSHHRLRPGGPAGWLEQERVDRAGCPFLLRWPWPLRQSAAQPTHRLPQAHSQLDSDVPGSAWPRRLGRPGVLQARASQRRRLHPCPYLQFPRPVA